MRPRKQTFTVRIKRIYCVLFISVVLIGLSVIGFSLETAKTVSQIEQRSLADKPDSFLFNADAVEKYISDHIPYRNEWVKFYFQIGFTRHLSSAKTIIGKNDWLYLGKTPHYRNFPITSFFKNTFEFTAEQKAQIIQNLTKIQKWCDENHIQFYLTVIPDKFFVYSDYFPNYFVPLKKENIHEQFQRMIPSNIKFVDVLTPLKQKAATEKKLFYYKQESHWNEEGALLAYRILLKEIQKDFPHLKDLDLSLFYQEPKTKIYMPYYSDSSFTNGNLMLPGFEPYNIPYIHYTYKYPQMMSYEHQKSHRFFKNKSPQAAPLNVYMIGDSYILYFKPFLSGTFQYTHLYRFNEPTFPWGIFFSDRQSEMLKEKINILILAPSDLKLIELLNIEK